jgi:hypothetical protein
VVVAGEQQIPFGNGKQMGNGEQMGNGNDPLEIVALMQFLNGCQERSQGRCREKIGQSDFGRMQVHSLAR